MRAYIQELFDEADRRAREFVRDCEREAELRELIAESDARVREAMRRIEEAAGVRSSRRCSVERPASPQAAGEEVGE